MFFTNSLTYKNYFTLKYYFCQQKITLFYKIFFVVSLKR
nr:MAG TPA: hypothetical protein [Caudoviricetes sp.]DAO81930.1 MAG TPA: hypothetical protein [Caudoviricetes sp.]